MKVLHVTPYFHGAWAYGGIPRLSFHLAEAMAAKGHEVHAVTTDVIDQNSRRARGDYEVNGVKARVYPNLSNAAAYHLQFFYPLGLRQEKPRIADYDLVHVHGHRNLLNTRMAAMAHAAAVPTVLMPNGTLVNIERRQAVKAIYDALLGNRQVARTNAFVAVSNSEREQFTALGVSADLIRVIPNGVAEETFDDDVSFKEEYGIKGDYLLYLGKITPRKGIEHAISALPLLDDKNLTLAIAGNDMGYRPQLERHAAKLGVTNRVLFTGLVTGPMKSAAYRGALYAIYAGYDEIFGLVPWESILNGTPVIVADDCGCGEWVRAGDAGHVVPYGEPAAIAHVINERDHERDQEMVKRGAVFCRERLDWGTIADEMVQYYRDVFG